jgi:hypothetical protein
LILEGELHVSVKFSKIPQYELKWMFLLTENGDRWEVSYEIQNEFLE